MGTISILDDATINKIAAGEVVEKPMAVVKELIENSIDANASAITVEIKNGGLDLIRITDNGNGIKKDELPLAFCRHATSKIKTIGDLSALSSLGFRGEALASIAAVSQVECITKTATQLTGIHYEVHGGIVQDQKEIGCPKGTTFVIKNIFFNTPARRKFLKAPSTEASYISDLVEKIALSRPDISFKYIQNGKPRFQTKGNNNLKDVIYQIYGRDVTSNLLPLQCKTDSFSVTGYIGKPSVSRGNRGYMSYFINGRYVKTPIIYRALEEGFDGYQMTHKYPFCVLSITLDATTMDVNVHPSKMEVRFSHGDDLYSILYRCVRDALRIPDMVPTKTEIKVVQNMLSRVNERGPEPFETRRLEQIKEAPKGYSSIVPTQVASQDSLFDISGTEHEKHKDYSVIGCAFSTYWFVQYHDDLYIMDQHAAHEKVLYERLRNKMRNQSILKQPVSPPFVITLLPLEADMVEKSINTFDKMGFEIQHFGGNEYTIHTVPSSIPGICEKDVLLNLIANLSKENIVECSDSLLMDKIASMACKAAVKGGREIGRVEAEDLIKQLFTLENPFHCPHGRPTMTKMTKYELEKRFGR